MRVIPMPGQECHDPMREEPPDMREESPEIEEESPDRSAGGVDVQDLAENKPVEEHPQSGQMLLDGRGGVIET